MAAVDRVPATDRHDERRARSRRTARLELMTQGMDVVTDTAQRLAARERPQRLGDLLRLHDAVALAGQVLEDLTGALREPVAADRPLPAIHPDPAQRLDRQLRAGDPMRVRPPAAITSVTRTYVEQRAGAHSQRRGRHPDGAVRAPSRRINPDLRERLGLCTARRTRQPW